MIHTLSPRPGESSRASGPTPSALAMPPARPDRDRELVDALRRRDADALERLVLTYQARAYRLAVRITNSTEDAEEVVQDACLKVINKIDSFRSASAFGSWLYRIVANTALQPSPWRAVPSGLRSNRPNSEEDIA